MLWFWFCISRQMKAKPALEKQGECDVQSESVHELHIQAPQVVLSANDQDPHEAQSEEDGNESAEGHVPLELFAEFLQAVMTRNYQLAKKLCQMTPEPQNSEAKSFLPLIEEKLLIADEESDDDDESDESDTSDEDDDVEDDDDEPSDSTDDTLSSSS
uniref:Glutamate-rich 2 n=1 Tax=Sinocyclocheilus anshuiensis TaxID=1608454 RepID=A0A671P3T3_9TELE